MWTRKLWRYVASFDYGYDSAVVLYRRRTGEQQARLNDLLTVVESTQVVSVDF